MNKNSLVIVLLVILLIVLVSLTAWLFISLEQARTQANQSVQMLETQKAADVAAQQAEADQKEQALEDQLKITWPTRGTTLCYEQPYSISWQAPSDMDAVTVTLYTPSYTTKIGDYPAVNGTSGTLGYGSFQWDLTDANKTVVPASQVYKLSLSGMYHGHIISTSTDGVFSIGNCAQ